MTTHKLLPNEPKNEQDAFEKVFPLPEHCTGFEGGYAPTRYNAWSVQSFFNRWEGWEARAALTSSGQAAPEFKRMPFSGGDVRKIYESVKAETGLNLSLGTFFVAFDAAERAHGIGV
jgi:hypothetical protein